MRITCELKNQDKPNIFFLEEGYSFEALPFSKELELMVSQGLYDNKHGEIEKITCFKGESVETYLAVGLGKKEDLSAYKYKNLVAKIIEKAKASKMKQLQVALVEGIGISLEMQLKYWVDVTYDITYVFDKYKTEKTEPWLETLVIMNQGLENTLEEAVALAESKKIAKTLVNEPANFMMPLDLAGFAKTMDGNNGLEVEIYDEKKILELGMHAYIAVAKGSSHPYRFIVMRYMGNPENQEILGLVGKGLTYDSGGYSIKPTSSMQYMKSDMGGAAAVIGAMDGISKRQLKVNVVAVVAACENCISGTCYKPGDIIYTMAGKTIFVNNTDAEGRLTLVDAVHYVIDQEKATKIVDIATLTGGVVSALGHYTSGIVSNNDEFYSVLAGVSQSTDEPIWRFPMAPEYEEMIKAKEADLVNSVGANASTLTAGLFIKNFVQDRPWIHIDIAGTAYYDKKEGYRNQGATGEGVYNLYALAKALAQ